MCVLSSFSCVWLCATLWTVAHQAPLSMGFSRQEYWNGLLCPPPGDLPNLGIKPRSLNLVLLHWRQILYFLSYQYHLDGNTPKLIYRFNAFPIENPGNLKKKNWQVDSKIHIQMQETQNIQSSFLKEHSWRTYTF